MVIYAVRGNKQLLIDEAERETYLKLGYDIASQDGDKLEVLETAPSKTVPYKDHVALQAQLDEALKEIESLNAQLAEFKKPTTKKET